MQDAPNLSNDGPEDSPPVVEPPRPGNNLPLQLTSFIGREREMAEVEALLSEHRLLTLTGPGGSGKTRLALAVASGVVERFENGVWLVELASLSDPDLVPQDGGDGLGVQEMPGSSLVETLAEHLGPRDTLLASLVDKSLVLVSERDGGVRYRLLETVRQYGRKKLAETGEEPDAGGSHARYYLDLAQEAEPELRRAEQLWWLDLLEREHDNLSAATRFLLDTGATEDATRMLWALWVFWRVRGHQGEGYRCAGKALERRDALPARAWARALYVRGIMSYMSYGRGGREGRRTAPRA